MSWCEIRVRAVDRAVRIENLERVRVRRTEHPRSEVEGAEGLVADSAGDGRVRRKVVQIHVDKGMQDGEKIVLYGEGDQEPDVSPGDIIIVIDEKPHDTFKRVNLDLVMQMELELVEALCGFQRSIETLDGRVLVVGAIPGEIIKPGDIKAIRNEGMPIYKNPTEKGRLVIQFSVNFPKSIPNTVIPQLEHCLPPRHQCIIPDDAEEVVLTEFDAKAHARRQQQQAYDDDEPRGGGGVQCQSH